MLEQGFDDDVFHVVDIGVLMVQRTIGIVSPVLAMT